MMKTKKIYYSRILVVAYLIIGVASYLSDWTSFHILSLNPALILSNLEFWRFLTFSFVPNTVHGVLLFFFAFWFIGPKLEDKFKTKSLILLLLIASTLQGMVFTLLFWNQNSFITGSEGISLFVISLYMLFELVNNYKDSFSFRNPISLPNILLVTIIWFASVLIHGPFVDSNSNIASILAGAFGIILSVFVFIQIKFANYLYGRNMPSRSQQVSIPDSEELIGSYMSKQSPVLHDVFEDEDDTETEYTGADYFSEERLNEILDKMNEYGQESLTSDEKLYLEEYSHYL